MKWFRLAALQGYAPAQYNLGLMYDKGQGVPQDYAEAVKWFRLAAQKGIASEQNNLGTMYANGQGVPQDVVKAHLWFNLASASGNGNAANNRDIAAGTMTSIQLAKHKKWREIVWLINSKGATERSEQTFSYDFRR